MGNTDNWSTPKQLKIERAGEPRGSHRGPLKKGERRKGPKARLDELKSAHRFWKQYVEWRDEAQEREHDSWWMKHLHSRIATAKIRLDLIRTAMIRDGIPTEGF